MLVAVDEIVLDALVQAATMDAGADEVTPPVTAGSMWTPERVAWLRAFHRGRRAGLAGPTHESTWAVVVDGRVVGSVRLKRSEQPDVLETGLWLTRSAPGQGRGTAALAVLLREAEALRAREVRADTTAGNPAALGALRRLGLVLTAAAEGSDVRASLLLADQAPA